MAVVIISLKGRELNRVPIVALTTTVGRDRQCDIVIDNPALSRHHATIHCHRGMFGIRDEGSANGIFVNGEQVRGSRLEDEDEIAIGKFKLRFVLAGGPDVATLAEATGSFNELTSGNPEATMAISLDDLHKMTKPSKGKPPGSTARTSRSVSNQTSPHHAAPQRTLPGKADAPAQRLHNSTSPQYGLPKQTRSQPPQYPSAQRVPLQRPAAPSESSPGGSSNGTLIAVVVGLGILAAGLAGALIVTLMAK
ncbi:MAG: FHA domain-containing protein [Myxococcales bacterium]|nr:FHA domain-containing protein [Myxococcales bacterium]